MAPPSDALLLVKVQLMMVWLDLPIARIAPASVAWLSVKLQRCQSA
jgi:hypothetical protein